jgi:ferredoxin-NADP reductase
MREDHQRRSLIGPAPVGAKAAATRWLVPDPGLLWELAEVVDVIRDTAEATTLRLRLPEAPELLPGQYYLVRLAIDGRPGAVEQAFSISSSPYPPSPQVEITVREVPGGRASPHLVHEMRVGDQLHMRGPYGFLTWTEEDGGPLVLIGAGSGVAPLISIVRYGVARGSTMPMALLCSSRDRSRVLFHHAIDELLQQAPWLSVVHTFTRSPEDDYARYHRRMDASMIDEVARSLLDVGLDEDDLADTLFLVAGSSAMVGATRAAIVALGVSVDNVSSENHA